MTSGSPIFEPFASSAMRWCVARAISRPPPSAAPLIAETTGLPSVSRRRSRPLIDCDWSKTFCASAFVYFTRSSRLPPAKKVFFAEVRTTPVIESFSASRRSRVAAKSSPHLALIVLAEAVGSSIVSVTMPSPSASHRNMFSDTALLTPRSLVGDVPGWLRRAR